MAEANVHRNATDPVEIGHELSDLRPRYIALFGIGLALILGMVVILTFLLMHYKTAQHERRDAPLPGLVQERQATPQPRLQVGAHNELREMRAGEDTVLNSYGWVDRDAGIVRIPVDRAMEVLAAKGLPVRPQADGQKGDSEKRGDRGATQ
jgi:hypothetical protein